MTHKTSRSTAQAVVVPSVQSVLMAMQNSSFPLLFLFFSKCLLALHQHRLLAAPGSWFMLVELLKPAFQSF
jgi:hypothetical protein